MPSNNERRADHNRLRGKYTRQFQRTEMNKRKAWKRHLAQHPNDLQAKRDIGRVINL